MCTVTSNNFGGQPVSLENLRAIREVCDRYRLPLFLDACRFAENAWFIKQRESGQHDRPVRAIVRDMFDLADGATISAKKDGMVNIGGVLLVRDEALFQRASNLLILTEGYVTYGGLAGRDLEAMAQGFREVLDEDYLRYRIRSAEYVGEKLLAGGHSDHRTAGRTRHLHRRDGLLSAHPARAISRAGTCGRPLPPRRHSRRGDRLGDVRRRRP